MEYTLELSLYYRLIRVRQPREVNVFLIDYNIIVTLWTVSLEKNRISLFQMLYVDQKSIRYEFTLEP